MSDPALNPWTRAWADVAAYVWVVAVVTATFGALAVMGRLTRAMCLRWGLLILVPLVLAVASDGETLHVDRFQPGREVEP